MSGVHAIATSVNAVRTVNVMVKTADIVVRSQGRQVKQVPLVRMRVFQ